LPARIRTALPTANKRFASWIRIEIASIRAPSSGSFTAAKQIVMGGLAVSAAIESQISRELSEGVFVRLPIDAPALSLNYGFITKRGRTLSPAAKAFMGLVRAIESEIPQ
jgi:DNA-binding transcriptional LysR family regulator